MPYGKDLLAETHSRHSPDNPFCSRCGFRTYPEWEAIGYPHDAICVQLGEHAGKNPRIPDIVRDVLSNLHFIRLHPREQILVLMAGIARLIEIDVAVESQVDEGVRVASGIVAVVKDRTVSKSKLTIKRKKRRA